VWLHANGLARVKNTTSSNFSQVLSLIVTKTLPSSFVENYEPRDSNLFFSFAALSRILGSLSL